MAKEFVRSEQKAKNKALRIDTGSFDQAVELTSVATAGTFDAGVSAGAILLKVNGTAVKIPYYTV
jgi:hypothetical protein